MCGRFALRTRPEKLAREFGVREVPPAEERYNIAPTQLILSVHGAPEGREARWLKWGLIPSWAKDASVGNRLINARGETVAEKPAFREAFRRRRCVVPADGFYEWRRAPGRKQPFYFRPRDERPFGFAAVWERWAGEAGQVVESCAILTTAANDLLRPVHDRMPVILRPRDYDLWLAADVRGLEQLKDLLRPYPASEMVAHPVGAAVNNPRNQGAELIAPTAGA